MSNISVIIRCRNEENHIGLAIQSVIDNFDNPEIIVVDNNSTDESMKVVSLFDRHNIIKLSMNGNYTPGKALNLGVSKASNKYILILSAHGEITKMDMKCVMHCLDDEKIEAVFGNQVPIYRGKRITKRYIWMHFTGDDYITNMVSPIEKRHFLHNAFCFYNREFLLENPFDESLSGKEDRYWADNLVNVLGKGYFYTSLIEIKHYWTPNGATWKGLG